jgi:branched-chain amino acid transport system substrate-binding protein
MNFHLDWKATVAVVISALSACGSVALAQKAYDPGASDTEIKIGNISPYSGPASPYSAIDAARR